MPVLNSSVPCVVIIVLVVIVFHRMIQYADGLIKQQSSVMFFVSMEVNFREY